MPDRFGDYRLLRPLGEGTTAELFVARRERGQSRSWARAQEVVLKRLRPALVHDHAARESLWVEAELGARLRHPNLVQVHERGEHAGLLFFAMELVRGPSLHRVLGSSWKSGRRIALGPALCIVLGLAAALEQIHRAGVVHRDLSPQNVVIDAQGNARLLDFGDAALLDGRLPIAAGVLGSAVAYRAPELCRDPLAVDVRSDLFALGVILWELTAGRSLFAGGSRRRVVERILTTDAPSPRSLDSGYPARLEPIVLRALERDATRRFVSAAAMRRAVEDVAFALGVDASAPGLRSALRDCYHSCNAASSTGGGRGSVDRTRLRR